MTNAVRAGVNITHRDQLPSSSRYELLVRIASGGMATVYVGRLSSSSGVSRLVAVKRAHAHLLEDPEFARMLISEARLASRIHHPNVVAVQNVEEIEGELLLVMDYVEGASLSDLMQVEERPLPPSVSVRVLLDACAGLHAAHELVDDDGRPLGIVHRDVSPHNIIVGVEGVARLTDFGIAKSSNHTASSGRTTTGALKGKVAYMAPEYVESGTLDVRSDVFALGIVAWESLTRQRLFRGASEVDTLKLVLATKVPRPSDVAPSLGSALDTVILKALDRSPEARFASAAEFGEALETAARGSNLMAKHAEVASFVRLVAGPALEQRRSLIRARHGGGEPSSDDGPPVPSSTGRAEQTASRPVQFRQAVTADLPITPLPVGTAESAGTAARSFAPPAEPVAEVAAGPEPSRVSRRALILAGAVLTVAGGVVGASRIAAAPRRVVDPVSASVSPPPESAPIAVAPSAATSPEERSAESSAVAAPTTAAIAATAGRPGPARTPSPDARPRATTQRKPPKAAASTKAPETAHPAPAGTADRAPPNPYGR